ncbi:hypothetical protein TNCV_1510961 [Trichonephila clavipes]|nr:hypothetical protein TNCV_1510961 [Trichonephila clavipes]
MASNSEIVTSVQEDSEPVDDETDEDDDNNKSSKGPSNADVFSVLQTTMACVRFHILHGSHSVFGYPNNRLSEGCPVPIDSDKRHSTVYVNCVVMPCPSSVSRPIIILPHHSFGGKATVDRVGLCLCLRDCESRIYLFVMGNCLYEYLTMYAVLST